MSRFDFIQTSLSDLMLVQRKAAEDHRGFLSRFYCIEAFAEAGIKKPIVQINQTLTRKKGAVRGLHFQHPPHAEIKLVSCLKGEVLDVAVDIRKGSPTYGEWVAVELSAENGKQLLIPIGFLHGFVTLEPDTEILYKCTDYYAPECDGAIRFDDPDIGIDWRISSGNAILSEKDAAAPLLKDFDSPFTYEPAT